MLAVSPKGSASSIGSYGSNPGFMPAYAELLGSIACEVGGGCIGCIDCIGCICCIGGWSCMSIGRCWLVGTGC